MLMDYSDMIGSIFTSQRITHKSEGGEGERWHLLAESKSDHDFGSVDGLCTYLFVPFVP